MFRCLIAAAAAFVATAALAQPAPAPTLLLPYFETSLTNDDWSTTFTISNATGEERIAEVNLWTDRGYPVLFFWAVLNAKETVRFNLRDILRGRLGVHGADIRVHPHCVADKPDSTSPVFDFSACLLTVGRSPGNFGVIEGSVVGLRHAHAIGFITVDVVGDCRADGPSPDHYEHILDDAALTGTFELRAAGVMAAEGPLVPIPTARETRRTFYQRFSAGRDHRKPLPSSVTIDLPPGGDVDVHVWREPALLTLMDFAKNRSATSLTTIRTRRRWWRRHFTVRATADQTQIAVVVAKATRPDATSPPRDVPCSFAAF